MPLPPLIDAATLMHLLQAPRPPLLLDCGFELADTGAGERAYAAGHLPGAVYAHLDRDLCGEKTGRNGRHPLPARTDLAVTLGRWGLAPGRPVVAYDAQGSPYAARAWWLLRWMGHPEVAVLDGGVQAWLQHGGTLSTTLPAVTPLPPYPALPPAMPAVGSDDLLAAASRWKVVDARAGERFRGEVEPLDPVAGRIPGSVNRFFKDNLGADGRFRPAAELREVFAALSGGDPAHLVHLCGSGVTACVNLLAMEHAGLAGSALYPGSWSEWCADPARPVARG